MEVYFPSRFVSQVSLENEDECAGKYTKGLGQRRLGYVDDREDIGSAMLTSFANLLEKYQLEPASIGRLEVGSETLIDKSKSVKTTLLRMLGPNHTNIEGVTSVNACYGGTAALLNSVAWVESSDWDGRYAVVIAGDVAVYEAIGGAGKCGAARATQGCGVVAMLVGPDAPLALEPGRRGTHAMDVYDFYKPRGDSEYAVVDGALSQNCYLRSVDACYERYKYRVARNTAKNGASSAATATTVNSFDYVCMHSPYNKLVQKGFARLLYGDLLDIAATQEPSVESTSGEESSNADNNEDQIVQALRALIPTHGPAALSYEAGLNDKGLDAALRKVAAPLFEAKCGDSSFASIEVGNCYTGAVYLNLLSLVCRAGEAALLGKRIAIFSYGSGSMATLFSLTARQPTRNEAGDGDASGSPFSLSRIQETVRLIERLESRVETSAQEFGAAMDLRAAAFGKAPHVPVGVLDSVAPGVFYLENINDKYHRLYARKEE